MTVFQDVTSFAFTHVCQDNDIWGYDAVYVVKRVQTFRRNLLPPFSG